jgi:hypothetical protein
MQCKSQYYLWVLETVKVIHGDQCFMGICSLCQQISLKRWSPCTRLSGVTSQKTIILTFTTMRSHISWCEGTCFSLAGFLWSLRSVDYGYFSLYASSTNLDWYELVALPLMPVACWVMRKTGRRGGRYCVQAEKECEGGGEHFATHTTSSAHLLLSPPPFFWRG